MLKGVGLGALPQKNWNKTGSFSCKKYAIWHQKIVTREGFELRAKLWSDTLPLNFK